MGIAGFFIWLQRNYRAAIEPIGPDVITAADGYKLMAEKRRVRRQQEEDDRLKREESGEDMMMAMATTEDSVEAGADDAGATAAPVGANNNRRGQNNNNADRYDGPPRRFGPAPSFDSLYLDMNGLIHPCCHHTAPNPEPECEEEMFERVFKQVDALMEIARPKKLLFLAVDGVAPRSKMNQQRARRFRAATERQEANEIAQEMAECVKKLHDLPVPETKERWDHNVITPSTPFMERVGNILEWYILKRLNSENELWKNLTVVLSDAHVPGEGEHKIMHYIRALRNEEDYDPTTHHLISGMDADLIVLGAVTHELNFSILRNRLDPETKQPQHDKYCVFSIRKFRELLQKDFSHLTGYMDFERIIDDFVYLCFFIGNDFLPHMPLVEIKQRGIETMLDHYVNIFFDHFKPEDYITNNADQLEGDDDNHHHQYRHGQNNNNNDEDDDRYNNNNASQNKTESNKNNKNGSEQTTSAKKQREPPVRYLTEKGEILFDNLRYFLETFVTSKYSELLELHVEKTKYQERAKQQVDARIEALNEQIRYHLAELKPDRSNAEEVGANVFKCYVQTTHEQRQYVGGQYNAPFEYGGPDYRIKYYCSKFGWAPPRNRSEFEGALINNADASVEMSKRMTDEEQEFEKLIATCCREYLRGMQWVMRYYTVGVPSWSWFYPYHFAPLLEDVAKYCYNVNIDMKLDAPLHPVHQLLAVLPQESYQALPVELHDHVLKQESALTKFYPTSIEVDFTEATFSYQGVIKLPFISVEKLRKTADKVFNATPDHGCSLVFVRNETDVAKRLVKALKFAKNKQTNIKKKSKKNDASADDPDEDDDETNRAGASAADDDNATSANSLPLIPHGVIKNVPIAGRIGKYEFEWPIAVGIDCPDRGFQQYSKEEGAPIRKNWVKVFKYEMRMHSPYLPKLLVPEADAQNHNNNHQHHHHARSSDENRSSNNNNDYNNYNYSNKNNSNSDRSNQSGGNTYHGSSYHHRKRDNNNNNNNNSNNSTYRHGGESRVSGHRRERDH